MPFSKTNFKRQNVRKGLFLFSMVCITITIFAPCQAQLIRARGNFGKQSNTPLVYDGSYPTSVMYESLMSHFKFSSNGIFRLKYISVAFLPTKDTKGNAVNYDNPKRFHVKLKKASNLVYDLYYKPAWAGNRIYTKFELDKFADNNDFGNFQGVIEEGSYTLEFYLDDKLFSEFPFTVYSHKNDDPYAEVAKKLFVRGPWSEYGFISWEDKDKIGSGNSPSFFWNLYIINEDLDKDTKNLPLYCELYKDGEYMATTGKMKYGEPISYLTENEWKKQTLSFFKVNPDDEINTDLIVKQQDFSDGKYSIKVYRDGKLETYVFNITGGKITESGRQDRQNTTPVHFIEGINQSWYIQKEGGNYLKK